MTSPLLMSSIAKSSSCKTAKKSVKFKYTKKCEFLDLKYLYNSSIVLKRKFILWKTPNFWQRFLKIWLPGAAWPSGWSAGFEIRKSWSQIPFWPLDDVSPEFNFSATLVNSQLVLLPPVWILNVVMFIYHHLFTLVLKRLNEEWLISYTYIRYRKIRNLRYQMIEIPKRFPEMLLKKPEGFICIA